MSTIGLVFQPRAAGADRLAEHARGLLELLGHSAWILSAWLRDEIVRRLPGTEAVITFGGDGTVLRLARLCAPLNVPILSVNFGRVGFMTEVAPSKFDEKLQAYLDGKSWIEKRILLSARITPASGKPDAEVSEYYHRHFLALNDVVVSRGSSSRLIRLQSSLDGDHFHTFIADGVILATPTGSTAYSMAAGGPVVDPEIECMVLTPIAPHLGLSKPLVLRANCVIRIVLQSDQGALCSLDGQLDIPLHEGDSVEVRVAEECVSLIRLQPRTYFFRTLADRLTRRVASNDE